MSHWSARAGGRDGDDLHGDTVVSEITVSLRRNGCMSVAGAITDLTYALYLLDTARDTVKSYHARAAMGMGQSIIVPAHDTALAGSPEERKLLAARDELANAMSH